jgi:predicted amidohydrolase
MTFKQTLLAIAVVGLPACVFSVSASAQALQPTTVAFINVNVIPLDSERIEPRRTVLVRADRIVAVGSSDEVKVPSDAMVIDGTGQYLVPGLTDAHVHLEMGMPWAQVRADFGDAPIYLAYGVTTVMNMGGIPTGTPTLLDWRKRVEAGTLLGPTIYTAGPFVNEPRLNTPDEVERDIVAQAQRGYDFIKFHELRGTTTGLSLPAYRRMLETARRVGIPLIGHAPVNLGLDEMLQGRQSIAHVGMLSNVYFLPLSSHTSVLLITVGALLILIFVTLSFGVGAIVRRWTGKRRPSQPSTVRNLTVIITLTAICALVSLILSLPGSPLVDSAFLRLMATVLAGLLTVATVITAFPLVRVLREVAVPIVGKIRPLLVGVSAVALTIVLLTFWVPIAWRSSDAGIDRLARRVHDSGIFVQSTLVVYTTLNNSTRTALIEDPSIDFLARSTRDAWRGLPKPLVSVSYVGFTQKVVGALHRQGVPIMAGTDAMGLSLVTPGSSLHRELGLLAASGLSPYEVLRSATVMPAAFLGKSAEFGTIAPGQRADLLLVNGNPLENLTVLERPNGVIVRGKWLPRKSLDELLKRLANGE